MIIVQYKAEATCLTVFKLEASVRGMTEQDGSPEIDETGGNARNTAQIMEKS